MSTLGEGERIAATVSAPTVSPEFVLSAGLEPRQSWLVAHKFKIAMLVVVAAVVAVFLLSR